MGKGRGDKQAVLDELDAEDVDEVDDGRCGLFLCADRRGVGLGDIHADWEGVLVLGVWHWGLAGTHTAIVSLLNAGREPGVLDDGAVDGLAVGVRDGGRGEDRRHQR